MKYHSTWHILHIILTLLTGGFWLIIWIWCWTSNNKKNKLQEWKLQKEQTEALIKLANKD